MSQAFETVIGLEVHCQLGVASKLFSTAPYDFGGEPNSRVGPVDLGLPGVLPMANDGAIELAVRAALALEGTVQERSRFDRKNYFYPDLPKGYQISQFERPYCVGGRVPLGDGRYGELERIHLEEDAGKTTHTDGGSLVDLNRAGVALVEIVGKPDLHAPEEAHAFLDNLRQILQYAEVSDCDMEKGSLRCDANISLRPAGASELGTKVEIKNLNSFRMVERALEYEQRRITALLSAGGEVVQETRLWNEEKGETRSMRSKESARDYRYFPDPDLPELQIEPARIERVRAAMPELPAARRARFAAAYGLPEYDIGVLTADRHLAAWFEEVARSAADIDPKETSNWLMGEVLRSLNERGQTIRDFPVGPQSFAGLMQAQHRGTVSRNAAKKVLQRMVETGEESDQAIQALGLQQISDPDELATLVAAVIAENPGPVDDYRGGKEKALHALKGMVMQRTRGKANPQLTDRILREQLAGGRD